ncbi:MAG: hypothetical protein ACRDLY_00735 [Thermoleophilaceae bacterium]
MRATPTGFDRAMAVNVRPAAAGPRGTGAARFGRPHRHRERATIVDIRLATPDVAIVSCGRTVHDRRSGVDASTVMPSTGALTYVTGRSPDGWRIALAQTTPMLTPTNDDLD